MNIRRWAVVGVLGLVAAACSDTTSDTTVADTPDTTAADTPDTTPETTEDDQLPDLPTDVCHYLESYTVVESVEDFGRAATALEEIGITVDQVPAANIVGEREEEFGIEPNEPTAPEIIDTQITIFTSSSALNEEQDPLRIAMFLRGLDDPVLAAPIHVIGMASHWAFAPGTTPTTVDQRVITTDPGEGAYVAVVDSGIRAPILNDGAVEPAWLYGSLLFDDPADVETGDEASHGTFIAGLIRQLAPSHKVSIVKAAEAQNIVSNDDASPSVPVSSEIDVATAIARLVLRHSTVTLNEEGIFSFSDVEVVTALNLSLGTYTCFPEEDESLVTTVTKALAFWDQAFPSSVTFAAAGNEDHKIGAGFVPFWPAALGGVRGIGAMDTVGHAIVWDGGSKKELTSQADDDDDPRTWSLKTPGCDITSTSGNWSDDGGDVFSAEIVVWSGSSFASAVAAGTHAAGDSNLGTYQHLAVSGLHLDMGCQDPQPQ